MTPRNASPTAAQFEAAFRAYHRALNAQRNIDRLNAYPRLNEGMRESLRRSYQEKNAQDAIVREFFAVAAVEVAA